VPEKRPTWQVKSTSPESPPRLVSIEGFKLGLGDIVLIQQHRGCGGSKGTISSVVNGIAGVSCNTCHRPTAIDSINTAKALRGEI
jgi:hypothetical protein